MVGISRLQTLDEFTIQANPAGFLRIDGTEQPPACADRGCDEASAQIIGCPVIPCLPHVPVVDAIEQAERGL